MNGKNHDSRSNAIGREHWGRSPEWDVDSGVLPAASSEGEPVLLVATQTEGQPSGTEQADLLGRGSKLCPGQ